MTTDSMPIPSWSEVQAALDAQQRRQNEQRREQSTINWLRGAGAAMTGLGFITGVGLFVAWLANHDADAVRHAINPYATLLTLGGLIVLGVGIVRAGERRDREMITAASRRDRDAIIARLAKLERRQTAEDAVVTVAQLAAQRDADDAFVDALSRREDEPKMNGRRVMRVIRPPAPDQRSRD